MQKLWRRSPLLCTSPSPWINANARNNPKKAPSRPSIPFPMPTAFHLRTSPSPPPPLRPAAPDRNPIRFRCSVDQHPPLQRPWVVFKSAGLSAVRPAWLHGGPDGAQWASESLERRSCGGDSDGKEEGGEAEDEHESSSEGRPLLLQRERRCKGSGDGAAATADPMSGNPDLLIIPGVGPRNLRKLVDKGIGGVEILKQLYRDKV